MKGEIKAVFDTKKNGDPCVSPNGNKYVTLLIIAEDTLKYYNNIYLTPKAHFIVEQLFSSVGVKAPAFEDLVIGHFNLLKGHEVNFAGGKNERGYPEIYKYYPKPEAKPEKTEPVDPVSNDTIDPDLEEDVPF